MLQICLSCRAFQAPKKLRTKPSSHLLIALLVLCASIGEARASEDAVSKYEKVVKTSSGTSVSGSGYPFSIVSPLDEMEYSTRFIEPTSPILGEKLVAFIKASDKSPKEILAYLDGYKTDLETDLATSCIAYFNVMLPKLNAFQDDYRFDRIPKESPEWTEVEVSAIPLEVLVPLHSTYAHELASSDRYVSSASLRDAKDSAFTIASRFQTDKNNCPSVMGMLRDDNKWKGFLPTRYRELLELNARISSAESAFPRLQHSINGYVRSIYADLCAEDDLDGLLESAYRASQEWIRKQESGAMSTRPYFDFVRDRMIEDGFDTRAALLTLCYSTRNMPNIDVEYAQAPRQALALEVYFWKMKTVYAQIVDHHFKAIFPNHRFERNPMLYHYATATYLAYEIRSAGYVAPTAVFFSFMSKAGYKVHKYVHALSHDLIRKGGAQDLVRLFKTQSSLPGIEAGFYGGKYGVELAREDLRASYVERALSNNE